MSSMHKILDHELLILYPAVLCVVLHAARSNTVHNVLLQATGAVVLVVQGSGPASHGQGSI